MYNYNLYIIIVLDIIQQRSQEMDRKFLCMKSELEDTKNKLTRLTNQEAKLVQQNAKTCMQLSAEEKKRYNCTECINL